MKRTEIKLFRSNADAIMPKKHYQLDSGYDLFTPYGFTIDSNEIVTVSTGLVVADISEGIELQVRSKSGLASRFGIMVLNSPGTIDNNYRGEIKIILYNTSTYEVHFKKGEKIAQLVPVDARASIESSILITDDSNDITDPDDRGDGHMGSTGR